MTTTARPKLGVISLLLLGVALSSPQRVDAAAPRPGELEDLVEYVEVNASDLPESNTVATKLPVDSHETPASVTTVGAALIDEQRAQVLGDTLINVSGVNVVNGSGVHDFFVVRGFDSLSSGLIMTDGAAEPEVTFYPTYNLTGVEVLKGPSGYLYGKDPMAGAVNLVRKQPLPTDFAHIDLYAGNRGDREGALDWNESMGGGAMNVRFNGFWAESDHYRDDKDSKTYAFNPSFTWKLDETSTLNFNLEYVRAEFSPDSGIPLVDGRLAGVPRKRSYQSPNDFSEQDIRRFQVDYQKRLSDTVTLRNKLYYRGLDWDTAGTLINGVFDLDFDSDGTPELFDQVSRAFTVLDDEQDWFGNQFEAIFDLTTGAVRHSLLVGVEVARQSDDFDLRVGDLGFIDLVNPVEPRACSTSGSPCGTDADCGAGETCSLVQPALFPFQGGESDVDIIAPYVIDQIRVSPEFQLLVGLRYDDISTDVNYAFNALDPLNPGPGGFSRDDSELSPMLGLVFTPSAAVTVYGNAGQSYAPIGARVRDAATLDPEEAVQYEGGVKLRLADGRVRGSLALYRIDRENIAITDSTGFTQQSGDQRSEGLELELAAEPVKGLTTLFSYAYTDSELQRFTLIDPLSMQFVDYRGNKAAFVPEHLASLWVSRRTAGGFGAALGLRYFDDQYIAEDNAFEIDGALIVSGSLFYEREAYRIQLHAENLTDEDYETRGIGSSRSTAAVPADGVNVQLGLQYRF